MFHYSLRVIDEPKMSEIRILNLCHKKTILVDIYRQSLLTDFLTIRKGNKENSYLGSTISFISQSAIVWVVSVSQVSKAALTFFI